MTNDDGARVSDVFPIITLRFPDSPEIDEILFVSTFKKVFAPT